MNKKSIGYILITLGVLGVIVSLLADMIGIGGAAGFGYKQVIGAVVGFIFVLVGVWFVVNNPAAAK